LGVDAAVREGLPDKFADGGSIGAHKSQDGGSRATEAYPQNVRVLNAEHLRQARH
jgi:hypothetical protein